MLFKYCSYNLDKFLYYFLTKHHLIFNSSLFYSTSLFIYMNKANVVILDISHSIEYHIHKERFSLINWCLEKIINSLLQGKLILFLMLSHIILPIALNICFYFLKFSLRNYDKDFNHSYNSYI